MYATKWAKEHPYVQVHPEVLGHLDEVLEFARSIGKEEQFVKTLNYACFPTFFGQDTTTVLMRDGADHSFYFEVYPKDVVERKHFLMNGGVIYHDYAKEWSVHT